MGKRGNRRRKAAKKRAEAAPGDERAAPSETKRHATRGCKPNRNHKQAAGARCTCPCYGGFAEAVPMDVWLQGLKDQARCPVHGKG